MSGPWLDVQRFPGRAHLAAIARDHRPETAGPDLRSASFDALQARWAARLAADAADVLLFAGADEAARLVCSALLTPGDVALLARPCGALWPAATLATGAAFVDVGRLADGRLDPAGVAFAATAHPRAPWLLEAPALGGHDDAADRAVALAASEEASAGAAIAVVDATAASGHGADAAPLEASTPTSLVAPATPRAGRVVASLHALRDPLEPAWPLLYALRTEPGQGRALALQRGPATLPMPLIERAGLALQRVDRAADERAAERVAAVVAQVAAAAAAWSGAVVLAPAGWRVAVRCDAGDAAAFVATLAAQGLAASAFGPHPMRNLALVDLGAALQSGRDRGPLAR